MKKRLLWLYLGAFMLFCVAFAHLVLQEYLYMRPCTQCIYIRYYMIIFGFGAIFAYIFYRNLPLFTLSILALAYSIYGGLKESFKLDKIHHAVVSANPFGLKGCPAEPSFDFGLSWHEIWPGLFAPTGQCGVDAPFAPLEARLDFLQRFFIELYSDGWYLLPQLKLINMAQAAIIIFILGGALALILSLLRFKNAKLSCCGEVK